MNELTKEKPKRPGAYWMVRPGSGQWKVVMLEWHLTNWWLKVTIPGSSGWVNLEYLVDCWWSKEPIERPNLPDSLATAETSRLPKEKQ